MVDYNVDDVHVVEYSEWVNLRIQILLDLFIAAGSDSCFVLSPFHFCNGRHEGNEGNEGNDRNDVDFVMRIVCKLWCCFASSGLCEIS